MSSLNAAAVVATLPEEEQQAAAAEGAEALKQAARARCQEKPKTAKPEAEESAEAAPAASPEELQARVTELEVENERLRLQVKTLQELLAEQG